MERKNKTVQNLKRELQTAEILNKQRRKNGKYNETNDNSRVD